MCTQACQTAADISTVLVPGLQEFLANGGEPDPSGAHLPSLLFALLLLTAPCRCVLADWNASGGELCASSTMGLRKSVRVGEAGSVVLTPLSAAFGVCSAFSFLLLACC